MRTTVEVEISDTTWRRAIELLDQFNKDNRCDMTLQEYLAFVLRVEIEARHKDAHTGNNNWW